MLKIPSHKRGFLAKKRADLNLGLGKSMEFKREIQGEGALSLRRVAIIAAMLEF